MRQEALTTVYELARLDDRVVFIGSDLGHGVLQKFKDEMPNRFFMEGISEQFVVGMAAGMAMEGFIPYVNTISTFLTRRCYEQVVLDLCLHNLDVRLIGNGGGLVYAPLGPTHLAIEDIAIFRTVPNMTIIAPADPQEMIALTTLTLNHRGPVYIRVAKGGEANITPAGHQYKIGEALRYKEGSDVLLITTGVALHIAKESAAELEQQGLSTAILHYHTVKPFDVTALTEQVKGKRAVITVEEGVTNGGLGSIVAETLLENGLAGNIKFSRIGIEDKFPEKYGSQASLMAHCGISTSRVTEQAKALL